MPRPNWLLSLMIGCAVTVGVSPSKVCSQTYTWNNTTGDLGVGANWIGGKFPTGAGALSEALTFGGSTAYTANNAATFNQLPMYYAANITFNNSSGGATLTATGTPLTQMGFQLGGLSQGGSITQSGAAVATITAPIYSRYDNGSGSQTLIIRANAASGQLSLGVANNTSAQFRGSQGVAFLNNSSNAILIGNLSRLGGGINVSAGNVQQLAGVGGGVGRNESGNSPLIVNSSSSISLNDYGGDSTPNGGFGGLFVDTTGSVTGNVQVTGGGSGSVTNQYSGTLNGSLRIYRTGGYVFSGTQSATGKRLDLHNNTSMTLSGTFNASSGAQVDHGSSLTLSGNERLSVGTTGVLQLAGGTVTLTGAASTNVTQTFATNGALSLTSSLGYFGASRIIATAGTSGTSTFSFGTAGGNTALAAGTAQGPGTLNVQTNTGGAVQFFNTPLTNGLIGGGVTFGSTSLEWATLSGNNVVALSSYQTNTNPNTWVATDNVKVSVAPIANLTANQTINSLNMASESTLTLNAGTTLTIGTGGVIGFTTGTGSSVNRFQTITGGTLTADTTSGGWLRFTLGHGSSTNETFLTVNSVIANQGANTVGLVKSGIDTLTLSGVNTFSGNVHVHNGTLSITAANNLGGTPTVFLTGGSLETTANMTLFQRLDVGASSGTVKVQFSTATLSAANPILGTNRGTFTLGGNSGTLILSNTDGGVADLSLLQVSFGNTLRLGTRTTGASLLGASTILNLTGTLDGSWGNTIAAGAVDGSSASIFRIRGGNTLTIGATDNPQLVTFAGAFTQDINGVSSPTAANLVKVGVGVQWLSGASSYTGTTSLLGGTLKIAANVANSTNGPVGNATSAILLGNTTGTDDATLQLNAGFTFARPVTAQTGSTGLIVLSSDTNSPGGLSTLSGAITLNRSVEIATPQSNLLVSGVVSGTGGIVKSGNGTLTVTGNSTYTGPTYISDGTLVVNSQVGSGTGTGGVIVTQNGTLGGNGRLAPTGTNTVTVQGGITAGTAVGASTLTVASNGLTLDGGGYIVNLFGTGYTNAATADISKLAITGNVQISSTSVLRLDLSALSASQVTLLRTGVGAGNSRVYDVIEGTGSVNNFLASNYSVFSLGNFAAGEWTFVTSPTLGTVQIRFTPVPEPAGAFGVALAGFAAWTGVRRRYRTMRNAKTELCVKCAV